MAAMNQLEARLSDVFEKQAPKLPVGGKKAIVEWAPWASLIIGILTLLAAYWLWQWAHVVSGFIDYANSVCQAYRGPACITTATNNMSIWIWVGLLVLIVEGFLYIMAFPGLRDHKKSGWNYLYWGALVNVLYAVLNLFMGYNAVGNFVGGLIGSAIGLWLLFQVRSSYNGERASTAKKA